MSVLVEVHDERELERALYIDPVLVGVNARNLKTLSVSLDVFADLIPKIPSHIYRVAESGISSKAEAQFARDCGADAILVGEGLVRSAEPGVTLREFLSVN
jgi:indole-3-glycerol phosphate synthase